MLPLSISSCVLAFLGAAASAQPAPSTPQSAFLTHKSGEPLLSAASAAEVQRGCPFPCADAASIDVYRAEIDAAGRELGLSPDDLRRAENNYIPNGIPRKRAANDPETEESRRLQARAVAQLMSDPHVSADAKQKLAVRMQKMASVLGGLQTTDGPGIAATVAAGNPATKPSDEKLAPRIQLPTGFKAFSPEPPMLSLRAPSLVEIVAARAGLTDYLIKPENRVPVTTLNQVPEGCALFSDVTNQECENSNTILLRGEKNEGQLEIIRRTLNPGENGDTYYVSTYAGTRLLTVIEINNDAKFRGTEAESFTLYHELRHIKTQKDIAALFGGHYPPEAAMTDELLTHDAEQEQYIKKHQDILTMDPPKNEYDLELWALARVRVGIVDPKRYDDNRAAERMLGEICLKTPHNKPCGGADTTHAYLKTIYEKANYTAPRETATIDILNDCLQRERKRLDEEYGVIWEHARNFCGENWTDTCARMQ